MCNHDFNCEIGDCECGGEYFKCETCGDEYRCAYCGLCDGECRKAEEGHPHIYRIIVELYTDESKEDFEILDEIEYSSPFTHPEEYMKVFGRKHEPLRQYEIELEKWSKNKLFKCISLNMYENGRPDGDTLKEHAHDD